MQQKVPTAKMRLEMLKNISRLEISDSLNERILTTMEATEDTWEAKEAEAARWVERLKDCRNAADVRRLLDKMGL